MAYGKRRERGPPGWPAHWVGAWSEKDSRAYLETRGLTREEVLQYDLGYCQFGDWHHRILIPIKDPAHQRVLAVQGRTIIEATPRYATTHGPRPLYIPWATYTDPWQRLVLVEGPFDAWRVNRVCPAVAGLGDSLSAEQLTTLIELCQTWQVRDLLIWYDGTAIPQAHALAEKLRDQVPTTVVVDLHEKDPGGSDGTHIQAILSEYQ